MSDNTSSKNKFSFLDPIPVAILLIVFCLTMFWAAFTHSESPTRIMASRDYELNELSIRHPGLGTPSVSLIDKEEELERNIVFINACSSCASIPAVVYAANLEREFGKQAWLEPVFNTFAMTEAEYKKGRFMEDEKSVQRPPY